MSPYVQCQNCQAIHREGALSRDWVPGTLMLAGSCPTCGGERFEPVKGVCDRCETEFAMKGDDNCASCALLIDAQDEADFHADNQQEPDFYRRAS